VRCAKTAKPIDVPFSMKTRMGPRNHVLIGLGCRSPTGRNNFRGCSENFRAQPMQPIGRERGGGIAQRGQSLIYTIALLMCCISRETGVRKVLNRKVTLKVVEGH